MAGGGRTEPGSRRRVRAASAVVSLSQPAPGDRLDLVRLVPSGRSLLVGFALLAAVLAAPAIGAATWPFAAAFGLGSAIVATWRARGHRGRHRPGAQMPGAAPVAEAAAAPFISEEPMEQEGVGL